MFHRQILLFLSNTCKKATYNFGSIEDTILYKNNPKTKNSQSLKVPTYFYLIIHLNTRVMLVFGNFLIRLFPTRYRILDTFVKLKNQSTINYIVNYLLLLFILYIYLNLNFNIAFFKFMSKILSSKRPLSNEIYLLYNTFKTVFICKVLYAYIFV